MNSPQLPQLEVEPLRATKFLVVNMDFATPHILALLVNKTWVRKQRSKGKDLSSAHVWKPQHWSLAAIMGVVKSGTFIWLRVRGGGAKRPDIVLWVMMSQTPFYWKLSEIKIFTVSIYCVNINQYFDHKRRQFCREHWYQTDKSDISDISDISCNITDMAMGSFSPPSSLLTNQYQRQKLKHVWWTAKGIYFCGVGSLQLLFTFKCFAL